MNILRTPEQCFAHLPDFDYQPHYTEIQDHLRMAHVEAGAGEIVLLLHGEPTWSFLYRKMIPGLAAKGYRAIAPDLIGFGRSDKPRRLSAIIPTCATWSGWGGGLKSMDSSALHFLLRTGALCLVCV